jgi:hypothetical protein
MIEGLRLDVVRHIYTFGARIVPSVTQALRVIDSIDRVPPDFLERARVFGRHVHQAIDLYNQRDLDETRLDAALRPRLEQYKKFLAESGFIVATSEQIVYNAALGYAGTLDITGHLNLESALIDLKSGAVPRSAGPQTAAYREAIAKPSRPKKRYALQLGDDFYKLIALDEPSDFSNFVSALNVYRYQRRNFRYATSNQFADSAA